MNINTNLFNNFCAFKVTAYYISNNNNATTIIDFRLLWWLIIDADFVLGLLTRHGCGGC
jgi:hypothetical protein